MTWSLSILHSGQEVDVHLSLELRCRRHNRDHSALLQEAKAWVCQCRVLSEGQVYYSCHQGAVQACGYTALSSLLYLTAQLTVHAAV